MNDDPAGSGSISGDRDLGPHVVATARVAVDGPRATRRSTRPTVAFLEHLWGTRLISTAVAVASSVAGGPTRHSTNTP